MLYGEIFAVCSEIRAKHGNKAETYEAQIVQRRKHSSPYLCHVTYSGRLWNSNGLIVFLQSGGSPWNSKRHLALHCGIFI
jgi:hypothetical protein